MIFIGNGVEFSFSQQRVQQRVLQGVPQLDRSRV